MDNLKGWYDKEGLPIRSYEALRELYSDMDYKVIGRATLPDGKLVSTVWLGLDHSHVPGPPLIFETMVFSSETSFSEVDSDRYHTETEAIAGHAEMVEKWKDKTE